MENTMGGFVTGQTLSHGNIFILAPGELIISKADCKRIHWQLNKNNKCFHAKDTISFKKFKKRKGK